LRGERGDAAYVFFRRREAITREKVINGSSEGKTTSVARGGKKRLFALLQKKKDRGESPSSRKWRIEKRKKRVEGEKKKVSLGCCGGHEEEESAKSQKRE